MRFRYPVRSSLRTQPWPLPTAMTLGVPFDAAPQRAFARFGEVTRRFEQRGEARGVRFVDDYAHLPTEVGAVLAAARATTLGRVVVVFQPHRYSRTEAVWEQFADSFTSADEVVVTDVYAAGEEPVPGITGKLIADVVASAHPGTPVHYVPEHDQVASAVAALLRAGDLCITLGAGDLTKLCDELLEEPSW